MTNPTQKFTSFGTGPLNLKPVAILAYQKIDSLLGSIIQLDGRESYDPENQPITWKWRFAQVPISSTVGSTGFKDIRPQSKAVSFIPDIIGLYVVELVVNDGELDSDPVTCTVNIQLSRVPVGENILPDASFLWNYISNFWNLVEDKEKLTTLWSTAIQLLGAELIKLWSYDYNKSLDTIQNSFQRRWQRFPTYTDLSEQFDQRIIAGKTDSGINGSSGPVGGTPGVGHTTVFHLPLGNPGDGDKSDFTNLQGNYGPKGRVIVVNGETYTISRVDNQNLSLGSAVDGSTSLGGNILTSLGSDFVDLGMVVGDLISIKNGTNAGTYKVKAFGTTTATLVYTADPPAGPVPSFATQTGLSFEVLRPFTIAVVNEEAIPDGIAGVTWRIPHLLHTPGFDLEEDGVRAGDIVVFTITRNDIGLSAEMRVQVVGCDRERIGFEFTMDELSPSTNAGLTADVVSAGGVNTISGLTDIRPASVGSSIELLSGANPGVYKILTYVSDTSVTVSGTLVTESGVSWVERGRRATNISRDLFRQLVQDLRIVPSQASDSQVATIAESLISYLPVGINLSTRQFSPYRLSFKATKIIHNSLVNVPDLTVSIPALQETPSNPPVVLRENLDYIVEGGLVSFVNNLFSLSSPPPNEFWAEVVVYDNHEVIEANFGWLVNARYEDISIRTRASYLSAVKGFFYAFTNGPAVANIRLGLQILLGLPFTETKVVILERDDTFSTDTTGASLGRLLVEDIDEKGTPLGYRRIYFYPTVVGLEDNPATGVPYAVGDVIEAFRPVSKGVTVEDYVKTPQWWVRALYGLEVMKFFTFQAAIDSEIFDEEDVALALEFVRAIKPVYTNLILNVLLSLEDDILVEDVVGGRILTKFYDNLWGLEATNKAFDDNQQGVPLWNLGSRPFNTRTLKIIRDGVTQNVSGTVRLTSAVGWNAALIRGRTQTPLVTREGDIVFIHPGQQGAGSTAPGLYEIASVLSDNALNLRNVAPFIDPDDLNVPVLNASLFDYGSGLTLSIIRREINPIAFGGDLVTTAGSGEVSSATAKFLTNMAAPGDHLVIDVGANEGEYVIDALDQSGAAASIVESGGVVTVTGLTGILLDHEGRFLEVFNGDNPGLYRILNYLSASSVEIYSPSASGADSGNPNIAWRLYPAAPYLAEDKVFLRDQEGNPVSLTTDTGQYFTVIRPLMQPAVVYNGESFYNPGALRMELHGPDIYPGWPHPIFTAGMVGTYVSVSDSDQPVNDGVWLITEYISAGKVVIDNPGSTADTVAQATFKMVAQL